MNWNVCACGTYETGRGEAQGILLSDRDIFIRPRSTIFRHNLHEPRIISGNGYLGAHTLRIYDMIW